MAADLVLTRELTFFYSTNVMLADELSTKEQLNEKTLLGDLALGDYAAFTRLYETHVVQLTRYAANFTHDLQIIEDSIHDVFVSLWNNRYRLQINWSVKGYLFKCMRTSILLKIRKSSSVVFFDDFAQANLANRWSSEDEKVSMEDQFRLQGKLATVVGLLTEKQKEVVYLRFYLDLSFEEIAVNMGLTTKACYKLMGRAVAQLRKTCTPAWQVQLIFFLLFLKSMG